MDEQKTEEMSNQGKGIGLMVAAVILGTIVYAFKPPSSEYEAAILAFNDPKAMFLTPPAFYGGMIVAAILAIFGLVKAFAPNDGK